MAEPTADIATFELLTAFRLPLIKSIIDYIKIDSGSRGLDAGCSIGAISELLESATGQSGKLTAIDYENKYIEYAKRSHPGRAIQYLRGDINELPFPPKSFDWIWSMDTCWIGDQHLGCPAESPNELLKGLLSALKPGGKLHLTFWTSQQLLPGYPILEARLNTATSAHAPFTKDMPPDDHVLLTSKWMAGAGFREIRSQTFTQTINGPLGNEGKQAINILSGMMWHTAPDEGLQKEWGKLQQLMDDDSQLLHSPYYHGCFSYTLFTGKKA